MSEIVENKDFNNVNLSLGDMAYKKFKNVNFTEVVFGDTFSKQHNMMGVSL